MPCFLYAERIGWTVWKERWFFRGLATWLGAVVLVAARSRYVAKKISSTDLAKSVLLKWNISTTEIKSQYYCV